MSVEIKPSTPFSNGMEYEFFLENFCFRCNKHKLDQDGFLATVKNGGCPIENALEDARFDLSVFPCNDVVRIVKDGEVVNWNICRAFETDNLDLAKQYKQLFADD